MQVKQAILSAFIVMGLSACGGGGGESQVDNDVKFLKPFTPNAGLNNDDEKVLNETSSRLQRTDQNEWAGIQSVISLENLKNRDLTGLLTTAVRGDGRENWSLTDISTQKYQILESSTKDGQIGNVMYFDRTALNPNNGENMSYKVFVSDESYEYTQFTMTDNKLNRAMGGFYRGNTTNESDMPNNGRVSYKGDMVALIAANGKASVGDVSADVDFGSKFINFDFNVGNEYRSKLSAKIIGSAFSGKQSTANSSQIKRVTGIFAGPKAEEMSGSLIDMEKSVLANFAAKQQ